LSASFDVVSLLTKDVNVKCLRRLVLLSVRRP